MASKIKKGEWIIVYAVAGTIDLIQFLGDLFLTEAFAAPEIVNAIADPFIGVGIAGYMQLRGVDMIHQPKRMLSLLGVAGLEEITGGIAPAWIVDIWYIHSTVKKEEAEIEAQKQQMMMQNMVRQPLYQNGMRRPETQTVNSYDESDSNTGSNEPNSYVANYNNRPLNQNGVRVAINTNNQTSTGTSNSPRPVKQSIGKIKV